jgi:hypothetical protein
MLCESCKNILYKRVAGILGVAAAALLVAGLAAGAAGHGHAPRHAAAAAPVRGVAVRDRGLKPLPSLLAAARTDSAKPAAHLVAKHVVREPKAPVRPRATISLYERTTDTRALRAQGCGAARRGADGIVILDFGKPSYNGHTYGTILFSGSFAGNKEITRALYGYAYGYTRCLHRGSNHQIRLARGTSNYHPSVPSAYRAGRKWARETMQLSRMLRAHGLHRHVIAAAADDVEPAWDRAFHKTRDFFRGFRDARTGHLLYNYGSLDGGIGSIWNARQAFYVAGGMKYARAVPEIYNSEMAHQWAELARVARHRYHRQVQLAGVMTEHTSANHGIKPRDAHRMLVRELATAVGPHARVSDLQLTNIRSAD